MVAINPALTFDPVDLTTAVFHDGDDVRKRRRRFLHVAVGGSLVLIAVLFFASLYSKWHFDLVWRYQSAGLLGASVGTAELLSRYKESPSFVLLSPPGIGYVVINAAASLGAMALVLTFGWTFGADGDAGAATQVLVAGFGSMALFRSSLLTVKAGNNDVGIGPSTVLSVMMAACDRSADRLGAADRAGRVKAIMADVSYDAAQDSLPTVAVALMQNLSPADAASLNSQLGALRATPLPHTTKSFLLGLKIADVLSTSVLAAAKESLGASILTTGAETREPAASSADANGGATLGQLAEGLAGTAQGPASDELPQTPQTPSPQEESRGAAVV